MKRGAMKTVFFGIIVLVVAFVVAAFVGIARQRAENEQAARRFLDAASAFAQRQSAQDAALQARFDQIDVDRYMDAPSLASPERVREGRAELARYRALLDERERASAAGVAEAHSLVMSLPEGSLRDQAMRGAAATAARNKALRAELSQAQAANADAVQAVFDWADRDRALLHLRDGKLLVASKEALDELDALEAQLRATGQAAQQALDRGKAVRAQATQNLDAARRDLDR